MKNAQRIQWGCLVSAALVLASCSSGGGDGLPSQMTLVRVSNGFGEILPHSTRALDAAGNPTQQIISIKTFADLVNNVNAENPVLPPPAFLETAVLPGGEPGNHFFYATFSRPIDIDSVLSGLPGAEADNFLAGSITVVALDPTTGGITTIRGRPFINGQTYGGVPQGEPLRYQLQTWVFSDGTVNPEVDNDQDGAPDGLGFPGTQATFNGAESLVNPQTFVFVVDADGDLATHETFPTGRQIRLGITTALRADNSKQLQVPALACTTVGADLLRPEVLITPAPNSSPRITPGQGQRDVDPLTTILVEFSEPIQPSTLGPLPTGAPPGPSAAISVGFGPPTQRVDLPFNVSPVSVFDLTRWVLVPAFHFPGEGPATAECGAFNRVDVLVNAFQFDDLFGNTNANSGSTFFETGEGPGLVNAPVSPDTIYVGRVGAQQGISVIDLNGFGGGTGNPVYDPTYNTFQEGWTNFPNNPNYRLQGSIIRPPLGPPTCTVNGGSAGVFTLTKDSSLNDLVVRAPVLLQAGDMALGHALDRTFNNGPAPFGCQAGGGNLCALDGQKQIRMILGGPNTLMPPILNNPILNSLTGGENIISWAPSPNPPPMIFPPLCISPFIASQEPTSIFTILPTFDFPLSVGLGLSNLLVPGDPFGNPNIGVPPSGLLSVEQNAIMRGPSLPATNISACHPYMERQQVGQFLYMVDRGRRELVVLNSNRMVVVDRILMPDPTSIALGTNLDLLAVSNQSVGLVSFVDINPSSSTFHQIVQTTVVGGSPRGIAWQPDNEDILVCNEGDNTMSIISTLSLQVRKSVSSQLDRPFDLVVTARQARFGFQRNVYFAYILNRTGRVAMFESGPNGVNGWGYDDVIGSAPQEFRNPKAIQADPISLASAVWIAHEGRLDPETDAPGPFNQPALSRLKIESAIFGALPLNVTSLLIPQFRDMAMAVDISIGPDQLSGIPVDIAFDNLRNLGGLSNYALNTFSPGIPTPVNGRNVVRVVQGQVNNTNEAAHMFVAIPSPANSDGLVDVIDISGGYTRKDTNAFQPGIQSIPVRGAQILMDLFRQ